MKFVFLIMSIWLNVPALAWADDAAVPASTLFETDWRRGVDPRIAFQAVSREAIEVVDLDRPSMPRALRFFLSRAGDYAAVANGTPRAEIAFGGVFRFRRGSEYRVAWQTLIPPDYGFDSQQPEVIAQIHQGPAAGYPPFALFIAGGGQYEVHSRTQSRRDDVTALVGVPMDDRGNVVDWLLRYVPDDTGRAAVTELYRDGTRVFSMRGMPNAYTGDDEAYLKLGIYKADWQKKPSDVDTRTLYYGKVAVTRRP